MNSPILTVVMPVYNGEKHIIEAIESVINQTFKDFELIIINDGSLDTSVEKILSIKDKRLRFIDLPKNKGIAYCRNLGIEESRGEFLAWTDCDDLNLPTRFEKQISFLENNPEFDEETKKDIANKRSQVKQKLANGDLEDEIVTVELEEQPASMFDMLQGSGMEQMGMNMQDTFNQLMPSKTKKRKTSVKEARKKSHFNNSRL